MTALILSFQIHFRTFGKQNRIIGLLMILFSFLPLQASLGKEYRAIVSLQNRQILIENLAKQGIAIRFPFNRFSGFIQKKSETALSSNQQMLLERLNRYAVLSIPDSISTRTIQSEFISDLAPLVRFSIDESAPNDSLWTKQWAHTKLRIPEAWNISKGDNVTVCVIDTGCDTDHKDLQKNLWVNAKEDRNNNATFEPWLESEIINGKTGDLNGIDDDGNGWTDDVIGYDVVDQSIPNIGDFGLPDPIPTDEHGHGTSVAGIIGAVTNNAIGIAGIAPNCKLMSIRAFDATGNAEEDDIAMAIVYAALNKARVICMSFGDVVYSPMTNDAIAFAHAMNCSLIASSGNDGKTLSRYPAAYDHVISVGATNQQDNRASFSSYGSTLSLCAPGVGIPTTAIGNGYRTFQGTSAAAPFVAGTAALVLGKNASLNSDDILGILQSSAIDKGDNGWDIEYGAGRLDPLTAVMSVGAYQAEILSPMQDQEIIKEKTPSITITGSTSIPKFSSWNLSYGLGSLPSEWTVITNENYERVLNDTLGLLDIASLPDTTITLRLLISQSNDRTTEIRKTIHCSSEQNSLKLSTITIDSAWRDDQKTMVISAYFSRKCRAHIIAKSFSGNKTFLHDDDKYAKLHFYTVRVEDAKDLDIEVYGGLLHEPDTLIHRATIANTINRATVTGVQPKPYTLPLTYIFKQAFVDAQGKQCIAGTDYSRGSFGDTRIYSFANNAWSIADSLQESWIIRGRGDSDGDGIPELLAHSLGEARLFESGTKQGKESAFANVLFTDKSITSSMSRIPEFWSAGMADINGDGKEELIGFSDTTCLILSYVNDSYTLLGSLPNATNRGSDGSANSMRPPSIATGDFDADGNMEIAYGDTDGDLIVYEYQSGSFKEIFKQETPFNGATEFTSSLDIDGDGKKELIFGRYQSPEINNDREYAAPFWTFSFLRSESNDHFTEFHQEKFFGVRAGLDYRNGISAGNVDGMPGDEVILCLFPNLYVFGKNNNAIECKWYYPNSYSNGAVIADFDGNGQTEFCFGDGNQMLFAEFDKPTNYPAAKGLQAQAINGNTVILAWQGNAESYEIYGIKNPFNPMPVLEFMGTTNATTFTIDTLLSNTYYRFFVKAVYASGKSNLSNEAFAFTHAPIKVKRSLQTIVMQPESNAIKITYTGLLSSAYPSTTLFTLLNGIDTIACSTVIPTGDSSLLLTFSKHVQSNHSYTLYCGSFFDYYGTPTIADTIVFKTDSNTQAQHELYITSILAFPQELYIRFSEPIKREEAENTTSYILSPIGKIVSAILENDNSVRLSIDPEQPLKSIGKDYLLTAFNIQAVSGIGFSSAAGSSIGFSLFESGYNAFCYPQPWRTKESATIMFAGLPNNAAITIRRLNGEIIGKIQESSGNGGIVWDGILLDGTMIESGVYLYSIDSMNKAPMYKFIVIRQ